jgi:hypothetical protein
MARVRSTRDCDGCSFMCAIKDCHQGSTQNVMQVKTRCIPPGVLCGASFGANSIRRLGTVFVNHCNPSGHPAAEAWVVWYDGKATPQDSPLSSFADC